MSIITAIVVVILGPYILTSIVNGRENTESKLTGIDSGKDVIIQINGENQLIDVEEYIAGVLPGLVDWKAESEVIEAQAVAVRAKIYYAMGQETVIWASSLEYTYYEGATLKQRLGETNYEKAKDIYEKAVKNTVGIVG